MDKKFMIKSITDIIYPQGKKSEKTDQIQDIKENKKDGLQLNTNKESITDIIIPKVNNEENLEAPIINNINNNFTSEIKKAANTGEKLKNVTPNITIDDKKPINVALDNMAKKLASITAQTPQPVIIEKNEPQSQIFAPPPSKTSPQVYLDDFNDPSDLMTDITKIS
jgi:hypothetical protein